MRHILIDHRLPFYDTHFIRMVQSRWQSVDAPSPMVPYEAMQVARLRTLEIGSIYHDNFKSMAKTLETLRRFKDEGLNVHLDVRTFDLDNGDTEAWWF